MFKPDSRICKWIGLLAVLMFGAALLSACGEVSLSAGTAPSPLPSLAPTNTPVPPTPLPNRAPDLFGSTNVTAELTGGGSTRLGPVYGKWFEEYKKIAPNVKLTYQSTNSGNGRNALLGTPVPTTTAIPKPVSPLDFAGSDVTFNGTELQKIDASGKGELVHMPVMLGAVVLTYRIDGLSKDRPIRLSGPTIARIFMGDIKNWNDPALTTDNGGAVLPAKPIKVVIRTRSSSGSGTSEIFSRYLSQIDNTVREKVGAGSQLNWPQFGQLEEPDGTATANRVKATDGAIGYVDQEVAGGLELPYALIRNSTGRYIEATPTTVTAAAEGVSIPDDFRTFIINAQGENAYPLVGFTWAIVWKDFSNMPASSPEKAQALANFLWWGLHLGQSRENLPAYFAPLPTSLVQRLETRFVNSDPKKVFLFKGQPVFNAPK